MRSFRPPAAARPDRPPKLVPETSARPAWMKLFAVGVETLEVGGVPSTTKLCTVQGFCSLPPRTSMGSALSKARTRSV